MPDFPIAPVDSLAPGEMKLVAAGTKQILLCNVNGEFSALHPKCSHYGAPLSKGVLNGFRLICPWHHACFDARTGRHLEAPGCENLQYYPTFVKDNEVWVRLNPEQDRNFTPKVMNKGGATAHLPYVVVGGGAAGANAVVGLRQGGYAGPITLISAEPYLPYDRPQLSKGFLAGFVEDNKMPLRTRAFYEEHKVELLLNKRVSRIDVDQHKIHFGKGGQLSYAKICVATGSVPKAMSTRGAQLPGILPLHTREDAKNIQAEINAGNKEVVIVGASFIGMEAAMALQKAGCKVTVIAPNELPFETIFGRKVGEQIMRWHEQNGVRFILGQEIKVFEGIRHVSSLRLMNNERIKAAMVIYGVGVRPNNKLIEGLSLDEHDGIRVNEHMYAGKDVWVAGDIASAPQAPNGRHVRIEHWRVAAQQGTVAGNHMAGSNRALMSIPFFWTNQAGRNLRYCGHHVDADQIIFDGNPEQGPFLAFYIEVNQISAVLAYDREQDIAAIHELMWMGKMPRADQLKLGEDWLGKLKQ